MGLLRRKKNGDLVIDLTTVEEKTTSAVMWGMPSACPECGGRGYLDHIDPFREIMFQHCVDCFAKFEITRADAEATADA